MIISYFINWNLWKTCSIFNLQTWLNLLIVLNLALFFSYSWIDNSTFVRQNFLQQIMIFHYAYHKSGLIFGMLTFRYLISKWLLTYLRFEYAHSSLISHNSIQLKCSRHLYRNRLPWIVPYESISILVSNIRLYLENTSNYNRW